MLHWALFFFFIAIVAAMLGFGGLAGTASALAQVVFFGFLVVAVIVLLSKHSHDITT